MSDIDTNLKDLKPIFFLSINLNLQEKRNKCLSFQYEKLFMKMMN